MAIALIDELGVDLERRWGAVGFDDSAFPELCAERLEAAGLHRRVDPDDVVRAAFAADLPPQCDPRANFGQPPVTLFRSGRFFIDALFWVDGTTTVHDHAFSGAFQVLSGQSIETRFSFARSRDLGEHVRFGQLQALGSALRRPGDISAVPAGPRFIHALFHLARPSLTLVARTYKDARSGLQFDYSPAGIAFDPFFEDPIRDRIVQLTEMLRKTDSPDFERRVGDLIAGSDFCRAFAVIRACAKLSDARRFDRLLARVDDRECRERAGAWVAKRRRIELLMTRRAVVHGEPLRFLLAVLLNAQSRRDALALAASFSPDVDPPRQLAAWLSELSRATVRLKVGDTPFEPNILGLPPFGPGCEEALADLLAGRSTPRQAEAGQFIETLRSLPALECLFVDDRSTRQLRGT
jgi:hypothetical protein